MASRILAMVLSAVMLVVFTPAFAHANTNANVSTPGSLLYNYVALGDAAAAGYGMTTDLKQSLLSGKTVKGSYPALVGADLRKDLKKAVSVNQFAMSGMRVEELRFLLDDKYQGDEYTKEVLNVLKQEGINEKMLPQLIMKFRSIIRNADLITCAPGNVNFGAFLLYVLQDPDARANDPEVKILVDKDPDGVAAALRKVKTDGGKSVEDLCGKLQDYGVTQIDYEKGIRGISYAYYSFCHNYDQSIRKIRTLNRQAPIVVLTINDVMGSFRFGVNVLGIDDSVDLEKIYGKLLIDRANRHIRESAAASAVVDTSAAETFLEEIGGYTEGDAGSITSQFKGYCDVLEEDLLLKDAAAKAGISSQEGMNGAYDTAATCLGQAAKVNEVVIDDLKTLDYAMTHKDELTEMKKTLMTGIKDRCLENGEKAGRGDAYDLAEFVTGEMYGRDPDARPIGKLFLAIAIRTQMGDGFFQQPSARGHQQIAADVMKAVKGTVGYHKARGVHSYGKVRIVTPAAFCRDGKTEQTCSICGAVRTSVIPGLGPAGTKITKATGSKKKITVKWKKPSKTNLKKITGYEIRCSLKSDFSADVKNVTVRKPAAAKTIIKGLKAKKKYYVQIRTYKQSNGKRYRSSWSGSKTVKTR